MKKGEYDIWAMKMEHYLEHTEYPIWEVIQKGNGPVQVSTDTNGQIKVLPPKTAEEILARERERKARTTLLMAIPKDHLAKFHKMTDAKRNVGNYQIRVWVGMMNLRDCRNTFSATILKAIMLSNSEGWHKGADALSFDDLYNNLTIFESDIKGSTASSSSTQNVAFVSSESTNRHFARECRSKGNQENRRRDAGNTRYKAKDNGRRPRKQEEPKALVTLDGEGVDWTGHAEDEQENFALMAYSKSGSDTEVTSCSKECVESYAKLKKLYDTQREQLGDASIEIQAYTQALKKMSQIFTYGPKQSKTNKSDANTSDFDSCETNSSVETLESVPEPVVVEPKVVSQPKVWSDAPIIEEYELDSE
ncbi:hypothetical protein Tco_0529976 [Tanacetum coccineum]